MVCYELPGDGTHCEQWLIDHSTSSKAGHERTKGGHLRNEVIRCSRIVKLESIVDQYHSGNLLGSTNLFVDYCRFHETDLIT